MEKNVKKNEKLKKIKNLFDGLTGLCVLLYIPLLILLIWFSEHHMLIFKIMGTNLVIIILFSLLSSAIKTILNDEYEKQ